MMLLELKNVEAAYGNIKALKGINLSVPEGKIVTLIGANGAGKSTTMKTIMGIMKPIAGDVLFKGESIAGMKTHNIVRKGVVLVPEGRQILQNMTVRENLEMGAYQRNDAEGIKEDLSKVFERFPRLFERQGQFAGTLSGGEQQMLAMGRALMPLWPSRKSCFWTNRPWAWLRWWFSRSLMLSKTLTKWVLLFFL